MQWHIQYHSHHCLIKRSVILCESSLLSPYSECVCSCDTFCSSGIARNLFRGRGGPTQTTTTPLPPSPLSFSLSICTYIYNLKSAGTRKKKAGTFISTFRPGSSLHHEGRTTAEMLKLNVLAFLRAPALLLIY